MKYALLMLASLALSCAATREKSPFRVNVTEIAGTNTGQTGTPAMAEADAACKEVIRKRIVYGLFHLPFSRIEPNELKAFKADYYVFREIITPGDIAYTFLGFLVSFIVRTQVVDACNYPENSLPVLAFSGALKKNYSIPFSLNSDALSGEAEAVIAAIVKIIKTKNIRIIVTGHADKTGLEYYNLFLSRKRAYAVKQALVKNGIAAERIILVAAGSTWPGPEGDDRRAQIILLQNSPVQSLYAERRRPVP